MGTEAWGIRLPRPDELRIEAMATVNRPRPGGVALGPALIAAAAAALAGQTRKPIVKAKPKP